MNTVRKTRSATHRAAWVPPYWLGLGLGYSAAVANTGLLPLLGTNGVFARLGTSLSITTGWLTVLVTAAVTWGWGRWCWRRSGAWGRWRGLAIGAAIAATLPMIYVLNSGVWLLGAWRGFGADAVGAVACLVASAQLVITTMVALVADQRSRPRLLGPAYGPGRGPRGSGRRVVPPGSIPWRSGLDRAWDAAAVRDAQSRAWRRPAIFAALGVITLILAWLGAATAAPEAQVDPTAGPRLLTVVAVMLLALGALVGIRAAGAAILLTERPAQASVGVLVGSRVRPLVIVTLEDGAGHLAAEATAAQQATELLLRPLGPLAQRRGVAAHLGLARGERYAVLVDERGDATLAALPRTGRQARRWAERAGALGPATRLSPPA